MNSVKAIPDNIKRFLCAQSTATSPSINLLAISVLKRFVLLVYSVYQDANFDVKYTDVDYLVFTDAARFIVKGQSPYLRDTYRYTPLLAILLTPNVWLHGAFGKVVFCISDLIVGILIYRLGILRGESKDISTLCASVWLLNPLVSGVSTRGNMETILNLLVLSIIYFMTRYHTNVYKEKVDSANTSKKSQPIQNWTWKNAYNVYMSGILLAFAIHLKLYPIIYTIPLWISISSAPKTTNMILRILHVNTLQLKTLFVSLTTLLLLTWVMYIYYGDPFIQHTYLYHVIRQDNRHNFSPYFYLIYLQHVSSSTSIWRSIAYFLPQVISVILSGVGLVDKDIALSMFMQTFLFVMFNKVCTSQYFLWYLGMLTLIVTPQRSSISTRSWLFLMAIWYASQGIWLYHAYLLEFKGLNTFNEIFISGLLILMVHTYIACTIMRHSKYIGVEQANAQKLKKM